MAILLKKDYDERIKLIKAGILANTPLEKSTLYQKFIETSIELQSTNAKTGSLSALLSKYERDFSKIPAQSLELARLERARKSNEKLFLALEEKFQEALVNERAQLGNVNIVDINGNFIYTKRHLRFNYTESAFLGFGNTLTSNCTFWRKDLSDSVGLFDEGLKCNMDGEYFSRLTNRARLYFLDKPIANFRKQEITIAAKVNKDWDKIVKYEINYEKVRSYSSLGISKIIPFRFGKYLKICFLFLRFVRKMIRLDYYRIRSEKKKYYRNLQKQIL